MKTIFRHRGLSSDHYIEVRAMTREPGGLVTVAVRDGGDEVGWTMSPALAAELIAGLGSALAETLAAQR